MSVDQVNLYEHKLPALQSGDYNMVLKHTVQNDSFEAQFQFRVEGYRYVIPKELIHAVYPPQGVKGNFGGHFSHIVLKQATLPWERTSADSKEAAPWLAILLLTADELQSDQVEIASEKVMENGHETRITTLTIDQILATTLLPAPELRTKLCHVRGYEQHEYAVILGNRLHQKEAQKVITYQAHLVAFEALDWQKEGQKVKLFSLFSWTYENEYKATLDGHCLHLLKQLTARPFQPLGSITDESFITMMQKGYCPIRYYPNHKQAELTWYRGPLVPGKVERKNLPEKGNTSYELAYALGQLLAMNDLEFLETLASWKAYETKPDQFKKSSRLKSIIVGHDEAQNGDKEQQERQQFIEKWLQKLLYFEKIPMNYLIPHWKTLPAESINFFLVDRNWMHALLIGACSSGGKMSFNVEKLISSQTYSGFILCSKVVDAYPDLTFSVFTEEQITLTPITVRQFNPEVKLLLFNGTLHHIEVQDQVGTQFFSINAQETTWFEWKNQEKHTTQVASSYQSKSSAEIAKQHINKGFHWKLKLQGNG